MGQILRLLAIQRTFIKYGLDEFIFATHLFRPVRFVFYILPWNWFGRKKGASKFKIKELKGKYLFTLIYCFIEKNLLNVKK